MPGLLDDLSQQVRAYLDRYRNRPLLKGAMAASAIVAIADGSVSLRERVRVDQILTTLEALKHFDPHEGVNLFNEYADAIMASPQKGRLEAMKAVNAVASQHPDTARLIVRICVAVASGNRALQLPEQIEILSLCSLLKVDPADCNVSTSYDGPAPTPR